ncbi:MAG: hypothetical protein K0M50_17760 [Prolixibacteraceae bacterium]|nr:hypothetical protein [Prolixibacteraceae bacterium]
MNKKESVIFIDLSALLVGYSGFDILREYRKTFINTIKLTEILTMFIDFVLTGFLSVRLFCRKQFIDIQIRKRKVLLTETILSVIVYFSGKVFIRMSKKRNEGVLTVYLYSEI